MSIACIVIINIFASCALLTKIICFDFEDRGIIPSSSFDWGIAYYLVYGIGAIIFAGAIWLFVEKRKAKRLAKAEQNLSAQE